MKAYRNLLLLCIVAAFFIDAVAIAIHEFIPGYFEIAILALYMVAMVYLIYKLTH
jgi:hypothetical protein